MGRSEAKGVLVNRDRSAEPCLVGTWSFALPAMVSAWNRLGADESSLLDVIEETCAHADLSPAVDSVGIGGLPDATGSMSLEIVCRNSSEKAKTSNSQVLTKFLTSEK